MLARRIETKGLRVDPAFTEGFAVLAQEGSRRHDLDVMKALGIGDEAQRVEAGRAFLRPVVRNGVEDVAPGIVVEARNAAEGRVLAARIRRYDEAADEPRLRRHLRAHGWKGGEHERRQEGE